MMADLIREEKILHWGISEATEEYLRRAHKVCPVAAVQNRYSMMARKHEVLFPVLEELFLVPSATHIKTYYVPEYVDKAVGKLTEFFGKNL